MIQKKIIKNISEATLRIIQIKTEMHWIWNNWRWANNPRKDYKERSSYKKLMEEWQDINRTYLTTERATDVRFDCISMRG